MQVRSVIMTSCSSLAGLSGAQSARPDATLHVTDLSQGHHYTA